jgi:hypothetical protein
MLCSLIQVPNLCWHDRNFMPGDFSADDSAGWSAYGNLAGRFAVARRVGDRVVLARDSLGLNKLFFAIHEHSNVIAGNYMSDLLAHGVPFEAIYAVPAGSVTEIAPRQRLIHTHKFHIPRKDSSEPHVTLASAQRDLTGYFERLREQFPTALAAVCLSGGLDSALVAAVAREYFPAITAYTYSYNGGRGQSQDVRLAKETAAHMKIPWRLVEAGPDHVLNALGDAVRFGQDWRDFNTHCAIVNVILADAIAQDAQATDEAVERLVLTGDLMNELMADYAPARYHGKDYYPLPPVSPGALRRALVQGLQAGDREVGVFQSRGLTVVQPYAAVSEKILALPNATSKPDAIRALAGDRLPPAFYERKKARAQIGDAEVTSGILPLFVDSGRDADWLERYACQLFAVRDRRLLKNFIRAGMYRPCSRFPERRCGQSGYLAV